MDNLDKRTIGERIKHIRKSRGENQTDFAKRIDATLPAVSNWETGRNIPNNERLKAIADIGGITVEELLYGSVDEENASFVNDKVMLEKKLEDTHDELRSEIKKREVDTNEALTEAQSEEIRITNLMLEGIKHTIEKYNRVKDKHPIYILNGIVYVMDQNSDLHIKDLNIDDNYYDTIKVEKRTDQEVKPLLKEIKVIDTQHIIEVINEYHDYNVDIKLSRELTWDSMISDYDQILNY